MMLAASISEEVINRLSERGKMKVIARSSVTALAGFDLSIPEIARPLGVQYVLQGVLCRSVTAPTLTAELSDAEGFIVWSETFAEEVDEFDTVTNRLASQVANGVAAKFGDEEMVPREAPVYSRAYEQLLIGRQYGRQGRHEDARTSFERALAIEPEFAEPMLELALLDRYRDRLGLKDGSGLAEAKATAQEALALAQRVLREYPHSASAHQVVGNTLFFLASSERDLLWRESAKLEKRKLATEKNKIRSRFADAEHHFRTAISLNPSQTDFYYDLAFALEAQGRERDAEALEVLERAMARDPLNSRLLGRIAKRWAARGRYRQSIELLEKLKALPEVPPSAWWWQLELMHLQHYWDEKVETLIDMLLHDPGAFEMDWSNRWQAWWTVSILAWLGLSEEAEAWKVRLENMEMTHWMREWGLNHYLAATGQEDERARRTLERFTNMSDAEIFDAFHEWGMSFSVALAQNGELARAIRLMESTQHAPGFWAEREVEPMLLLAAMYQAAGRERDAQSVLKEVVDYLEAEYESGIRHPQTLNNLAQAYARQGRDDDALEMLRNAVNYHSRGTAIFDNAIWNKHQKSSAWFRLREDPRFIALIDRMQADLDQQAVRIRAMLAKHDVDALLAPLIALAPDTAEAE
jgi:TolB-like protein/Tfp pilus assembly protein PilF